MLSNGSPSLSNTRKGGLILGPIGLGRGTAIGQKQPLGCPLSRQVCRLPESREKIWAFVSLGRDEIDLHEKGIYFRSAHLANVILTPDGKLGPIDISDMKTFHRPLRKRLGLRNFKHMLRYEQDRQWLIRGNNQLPSTAIRKTCPGKAINAQNRLLVDLAESQWM